jgi:dienelactone hydrolase
MRASSWFRLMPLMLAVSLLGWFAPPASAKKAPDLSVPAGKVTATGTEVSGKATVRHRGKTRATAVVLRAEQAGQRVVLQKVRIRAWRRSGKKVVRFRASTSKLAVGEYRLRVCVDPGKKVRERKEGNNCRSVGKLVIEPEDTGPDTGRDQPVPPPCDTPACAPAEIPAREQPFEIDDALGHYWAFVPTDYNQSTPVRLLVWLHGCGGESAGDLYVVGDYYDDMHYIAIAPDGAEGGCWSMSTGPRRVRTAIADAIARFRIDPRRVVIGGYSSGGDLSYRTAFYNANSFAGLMAINTSPFRDTGSTAADSIAAAAWHFPIVHVAHSGDDTYPIDGVADEIQTLKDADFPVTFIQRPGHHYDPNPGEDGYVSGQPSTDEEIQSQLVPHMKDDWSSPGNS